MDSPLPNRKENYPPPETEVTCIWILKGIWFRALLLGISTFVMLSTESLLSISFTSSLSRFGGDVAVGAMTIITSISQLVTLPLQGICQGGQPIISYNFGANKPDRVKKAFFTQFCTCVIYTTAFWLVVMIFPKAFATIFTSDKELVTYSAWRSASTWPESSLLVSR